MGRYGVHRKCVSARLFADLMRDSQSAPAGCTGWLTKECIVRVLVAGDGGYIGAVLVPFLQRAGHEVHGLDLGLYAGCDLGPAQERAKSSGRVDMRDVTAAQLTGYDAVLCLAA